jgi:hypothetical protein
MRREMSIFRKNNIKSKQIPDLPGYGSKWLLGLKNSSKNSCKKGKTPEKLPNRPVDTSFVYYEDR